jgi:hypothetical protein
LSAKSPSSNAGVRLFEAKEIKKRSFLFAGAGGAKPSPAMKKNIVRRTSYYAVERRFF